MGSSVKQTITPLTATLSASRVISIVNTTSTVKTVTSALPTDTVTAAEELGRLKDEQSRLKKRKADLTKQVEISNKLLALKEQQLKSLTQNNALN
jgi:allophanate hydrolase subunit 1